MKTYWDYSEKERSEMTEEQVRSMLDVELMEKGVLKVEPPVLRPVENIEVARQTYFEAGSILFKTAEEAHSFLALHPHKEGYDYSGAGYDYKYAQPLESEVRQVSMCIKQDVVNLSTTLAKNKEAKTWNEQAEQKYKKACEAQNKVLDGVWEDWYRCRDLTLQHKKVIDTRAEYLQLTNRDEALARTFLAKVFTEEEIKDAMEWFEVKEI
jgi:DNA-directed RNA polymerase subunit N (RpoN/RPB10)